MGIIPLVLNPVFQGDSTAWNGTDESACLNALERKLPQIFENYSPIVFETRRSKMNVNKHMLTTAKTQTGFYVPSTQVRVGESTPATILWLEDLRVSRLEDSLRLSCKYLMWNNRDKSVTAYGIVECAVSVQSVIDWELTANEFGRQLKNQMTAPEASPVYIVTTGSQDRRVALRFKVMGHLNFHLPKKDQGDPYIPDDYEDLETHPSITQYFSNSPSFTSSVELVFPQKNSNITIGMDVNFESMDNGGTRTLLYSSEGAPDEETLNVRTIGFVAGYSQRFNDFSDAYWFIKGHLDFKKYSGKSRFNDFTANLKFDEAVAPGVSFGVEGKPSSMPFGLSAELGLSIASTNLSSVSSGGNTVPIDFNLADNQIYLKAGIFYDWKW